jgi:hypothetical protein
MLNQEQLNEDFDELITDCDDLEEQDYRSVLQQNNVRYYDICEDE